jgi:hypothetical protein
MKTAWAMAAALALVGNASSARAADVAPQTIEIAKVDVEKLQAGYRASKVIGTSVVNNSNETVGKVDDLLVSPDGKSPYAILSVGGFLGMGSHLVAVPYEQLKVVDKKLVLQGGTKDSLRMLPEFKYASD